MAAWTSLYNSAQAGTDDAGDQRRSPGAPAASAAQHGVQSRSAATEPDLDPYFGSLPDDGLGLPPEDMPAQMTPAPSPTSADMPGIPSFGGGGMPGGATMPGWGMQGGSPLPGPLPGSDDQLSPRDLDDGLPESEDDRHDRAGHEDTESPAAQPAASGPTTVTLPDGETLTAANPQLAAAIEAAAGGHQSRTPSVKRV